MFVQTQGPNSPLSFTDKCACVAQVQNATRISTFYSHCMLAEVTK